MFLLERFSFIFLNIVLTEERSGFLKHLEKEVSLSTIEH